MAQITRKDIKDYHDDQEQLKAWRLAERRREQEAFLQKVRDEAADLGRHLKSNPKWAQAIKKLRSEVLDILAKRGTEAPIWASVSFSTAPWRWKRRWNRLADMADECQICTAPSALTKGILLEGGLKSSIEEILPILHVYPRKREGRWEIAVQFLPPRG